MFDFGEFGIRISCLHTDTTVSESKSLDGDLTAYTLNGVLNLFYYSRN